MKKEFNNLNEMVIYLIERVSSLENDVKWVKRILYILAALLASILGLKVI